MKNSTVVMSKQKYMIYSVLCILAGALIVGGPILMQSKKYYEETIKLQSSLDDANALVKDKESSIDFFSNRTATLVTDLNRVKRNHNILLFGIERQLGGLPNGWSYEDCEEGLQTIKACR